MSYILNKQKLAGVIIALVFCIVGFYTLPDYGLNPDFPYHFYRGEAYLHYFLTGERDFSDIPEKDRCKFQTVTFKELTGQTVYDTKMDPTVRLWYNPDAMRKLEGGHPSLAGLLSALGCEIFYKRLHLLEQVDAHHALYVILSALAVLVTYLFALEAFNFPVAILSAVFLALSPHFLGYAHNSPKDIPVLCFLLFTAWAAWKGVESKSWKWMILTGIFYGLSLSVKLSGFYMPFLLIFWFFMVWRDDRDNFRFQDNKAFWIALLLSPIISILIPFLLWPYLWCDPKTLITKLDFIMYNYRYSLGRKYTWKPFYAPTYAFITTPTPIIILGGIGFIYAIKKWNNDRTKPYLLVAAWFLSPILAFSIIKIDICSWIRHFMSYIPPLCILAGIGGYQLVNSLKSRLSSYIKESTTEILGWILILGTVISILFSVIQIHPFQTTYLNSIVGGREGAQKSRFFPEANDYSRNSLRIASRWLNNNVKQDFLLFIHSSYSLDDVRENGELRTDVKLANFRLCDSARIIQQSPYPCYAMFIYGTGSELERYCYSSNLKPYHVFEADGVPILLIYKLK